MSSIYSAGATSILKSTNSSLHRKKIHEKIRTNVQFRLMNANGLRTVLEDAAAGTNLNAYEDYIRQMRDGDLSDVDFAQVIRESKECIELLTPKFSVFVQSLISLNWLKRNEELIKEYQAFLIDLLSEHNKYTAQAIRSLIDFWIPNKMDQQLWKRGVPGASIVTVLNYVHATLSRIMEVIPMSFDLVIDIIEQLFPYYSKPTFIVAGYVHNIFWLLEYRPMFREDILMLLFKKLVQMDVNARRADIESSEHQNQDVDMEEIFTMEPEEIKTYEDDEMHLPLAETIDICMEKLCAFIMEQYASLNSQTAEQLSSVMFPEEKRTLTPDQLYKMLLKAFELYVLTTYKTIHIQFVMFYFCSFKLSLAESFLNYLCLKVWDPNVPTEIRKAAVSYIASFIARAKYLPQAVIKKVLRDLCEWAHNYILKSDSGQHTTSVRAHIVFYAVCEAIFYVIAFRSRDLTSSNKNLIFLQSLQLSTLVTCHLNPLRVCQAAIATAFAGVTRAHQLAYCHTILERNARRKLATVYRNEVIMPEETLDTSFPFDPYILKKSGKRIASIYQQYQASEAEETSPVMSTADLRRKRMESITGTSIDDDDFLNEHKRNKLAELSKSYEKEMLFTYGTSPGFH